MSNGLISFLRHYGPIPASDNMYDELIQAEIDRHEIEPEIHICPARLDVVRENFESPSPRNIILTGTAGDGKTYHCRRIWEHFGGDPQMWREGKKVVELTLPASAKTMRIVKDLSELTPNEKNTLLADLVLAVERINEKYVFLIAANDGQLLSTWRDWSETQGGNAHRVFKTVEDMLVEDRTTDESLNLDLYNLSRLDASEHFLELIEQIVEHKQWEQCKGCKQCILLIWCRAYASRIREDDEDR